MRVSGRPADFGDIDSEQLGKIGRQRDQPQLLVRRPFVARWPRPRLRSRRRAIEPRRGPDAARTVQPSSDKAISSPSGSRMDPQLDVVVGRSRDGRTRDRGAKLARELRDRRNLRQRQSLADRRARPRAAALRARGRRRSAGRPCRLGRGPRAVQRERSPCLPPKRRKRGAIGRRSRQPRPRLAHLLVGHRIENADRRAGIIDPEQVADAGEQPGAQARGCSAGDAEQAPSSAGLGRKQLLDRGIGRQSRPRRARTSARKPASPSCAAARIRSSVKPAIFVEQADQSGGQRVDAARRVALAEHARPWPRPAQHRGRDCAEARRAARRRSSRPAPRRSPEEGRRRRRRHWPKRSRRRPRARISAIAAAETPAIRWLARPWRTRASRRPVRARRGGRDPLLIGAAQQHRHQARLIEQAATRSAPRSARDCHRRWRPAQPLGSDARSSSATSPTRQWSIAVISARSCSVRRLCGIEEESRRGPWPAGRCPRRARARSGPLQ